MTPFPIKIFKTNDEMIIVVLFEHISLIILSLNIYNVSSQALQM